MQQARSDFQLAKDPDCGLATSALGLFYPELCCGNRKAFPGKGVDWMAAYVIPSEMQVF